MFGAVPQFEPGMADTVFPVVYSTSWCPYSRMLIDDLDSAGIGYREVDVDRDAEAGELVKSLNNGNRTVPTVVFADGSSLTNPPVEAVLERLADSH
jgi:mycoredoxin